MDSSLQHFQATWMLAMQQQQLMNRVDSSLQVHDCFVRDMYFRSHCITSSTGHAPGSHSAISEDSREYQGLGARLGHLLCLCHTSV